MFIHCCKWLCALGFHKAISKSNKSDREIMEHDRAKKADLIKSLRSINEVVKEHPEMLNDLIMMLEVKEEKSTGTQLDARCM